jgi:hypothetical protein
MSRSRPVLFWLLAIAPLLLRHAAAQLPPPEAQCDQAAAAAEQQYALPPGILAAIGRVESNRLDPRSNTAHPWPWTVNAAGAGAMLPTREAAVAWVQAIQQRGVQSIDVGCFQVNLLHHPDAFPTLQVAFDPQANALYAGRFLLELRRRTGNWDAAIMAYHSADVVRGAPYRDQVLAAWNGAAFGRTLAIDAVSVAPADIARMVSAAKTAPVVPVWVPHAPGTAPDMVVIVPRANLAPVTIHTPVIIHTPTIITPSS